MRRQDGAAKKISGPHRDHVGVMALSREVCPCCIIIASPLAFPRPWRRIHRRSRQGSADLSAAMGLKPHGAAINTRAGAISSGRGARSIGVLAVDFFTLSVGRLVGLSGVQSGPGAIAFTLIARGLTGRLRGPTALATQKAPNGRAIEGAVTGVGDAVLTERSTLPELWLPRTSSIATRLRSASGLGLFRGWAGKVSR